MTTRREQRDRATPLGERLRSFRTQQGRSLRDIARQAGVNSGYLSQLERGAVAHPSAPVLERLADGYGLPFELLASWAGYGNDRDEELSANQAAALALIGDPTDTELRAVEAFLRALRSGRGVEA